MRIPDIRPKGAILTAQNTPLIVDSFELPEFFSTGQVLVKVHTSGICGSQLGEISGVKGIDPYLPHLMGHEGCGTVIEVGPGVKYVSPGDKVVLHWRKGIGIESDPPIYKWRGKKLNAGCITTFNTHAIVSENRCTKVPENLDTEIAALFGCAITTGFGVIENNAKLRMGESVLVFGAGGVGLNIIQASKLLSAYPIIAIDKFDNRLELAKKMGATHSINSTVSGFTSKIKSILNEKSLDVFVDNTGSVKIIELGYKLISKEGRIILVGVPKKNDNISIYSLDLHFGKTITGSHGGECSPDKDIPRYLNLMNNGKLNFDDLISSRYSLENINEAVESMIKGDTSGRILITT